MQHYGVKWAEACEAKAECNSLVCFNELLGRCGSFSDSRWQKIWLLRATPACKSLSHHLTTHTELSEKNKWSH